MTNKLLTVITAVLSALPIIAASQTAMADPLYGIAYSLQAYGGAGSPSPNPDETDLTSSSLPFSDSVSSIGTGAGNASISVSIGNGNVGLHGLGSASTPGGNGSYGSFDLFYYDTFYISGSGLETFNFTLNLDATVTSTYPTGQEQADGSSTSAYGGLELGENGSYVTWGTVTGCCYGSISVESGDPVDNSYSGSLQLQGGTSVELDLYLYARTLSNAPLDTTADISSEFDALNTAWLTLTPVTPGAGFTTASGLTYAAAPDTSVPEPSSLVLLGGGLFGLLASRRVRRVSNTNNRELAAAA